MKRLVTRELEEIQEFIDNIDATVTVIRQHRNYELITTDAAALKDSLRQRFDTETAATLTPVGQGNITTLYDVPDVMAHLTVIQLAVPETRSERGFNPVVTETDERRPLTDAEIQSIDEQLRESDLQTNGLTKGLYDELQEFRVPDRDE